MVPEGWCKASVGQLCDFINGRGFSASEWSDRGYPIIRIQNLNGSKEFNFYEGETKEQWIVEPGQLLFAWAGTKGVSFGPKVWRGPKGVLNQHIYKLRAKGECDPHWLFESLLRVTEKIESKAHGFKATLLHVQKADITEQVINVPPLPEQKKIARILSTWDKAIETVEKLIENSRHKKKALMQQLLTGKKRFPGFDGEWKEIRIGDCLTESRVPSSSNDPSKRLTVKLHLKGIERRECRGTEAVDSTAHFVRTAGQFIYGKQNIHKGALGIIPKQFDGLETSQDIPAFDFLKGHVPMWLYYFIAQERFYADLEILMTGTGSKRLKPKDFLRIRIKVPDENEQGKIVDVLINAENEVRNLEAQLVALKKEKSVLMQQLLTGKKRVVI